MRRFKKLMLRGLLLRCPSCGHATLVRGVLRVHDRCRVCGLPFEHDEGFFLGALVLNYTVSFLTGILPAIVLVAAGRLSVAWGIVWAVLASLLVPVLFYWHAKSLWMAAYYFFVPDDLRPGRWQQLAEPEAAAGPLSDEERARRELEEAIAALEGMRMTVAVEPARLHEKSVLRRLLELYRYDFSEFDGADVDEHGLFGYRYLDHYWTEPDRLPFLIRADGKLAGFALLRREEPGQPETLDIAEFFIMRRFRRGGVGRHAAFALFDRFRGRWEIRETAENVPAQQFWRRIVGEYTGGRFEETVFDRDDERFVLQTFDNTW
jgi:predicted acetyltransferase/uncharacterized protein (DUF983 family)